MNELNEDKVKRLQLLREKQIRNARKSFYEYCKIINPDFYKPNRDYLKVLCNTLQSLYEGTLINEETGKPYKKLSINLPPGFGKSYTASLFSQWCLGQEITNQVITASYNEKLAQKFSRTVRDGIGIESTEPFSITYADIFPNSKIKRGDSSVSSWALEGHYMNYLATSMGGTLTGMRGNICVLDDLIKSSTEAFSERALQDIWDWYTDTFLSRVLEKGIIAVIATRWASKDLTGRLIEKNKDEWYELKMKACLNEDTHEMLCPELLSWERYSQLKELTSEEIFMANFQQVPVSVKGKLYQTLQTYEKLPEFEKIINYTDTSDKGADYLCSITAGLADGQLYITDVLYTQDDMSITEGQTAQMLLMNKVNNAIIESNNGGEGFARSVERILHDVYKSRFTDITTFHQNKNKESRILTMSSFVQRNVFFPSNWGDRWNDFYIALNTYQREFKNNKHDDAPDALTGLCEQIVEGFNNQWKAVPSLY